MGLTKHAVRFLLHCQASGVDFTSCATIGRQVLYLSKSELRGTFAKAGLPLSSDDADRVFTAASHYAEPLFGLLGAATMESFDASAYERATHVADFNLPVPDPFRERYTAVVDGGSLEHVFNYPQGLKNAMELVKPGGHLILIAPTHSLSGHGFYQLSAEVFFRSLSEANGFEAPRVFVCSRTRDAWYRVADPASVEGRILVGGRFLSDHLFVLARRVRSAPIFASWPQQSDYSSTWTRTTGTSETSEAFGMMSRLRANRHRVPGPVLRLYRRVVQRSPQGLTRERI